MVTTNIKIEGLKELDAILKSFPARLEKNILRTALRQSSNVLRDAARQNASSMPGIAKNIKVKSLKSSPQLTYMATAVDKTPESYYARFVEFGTASHYAGLNNKTPVKYTIKPKNKKALAFEIGGEAGSQKIIASKIESSGRRATPFMRPAIDASINQMITTFKLAVNARIKMEFGSLPRQRVTASLLESIDT
jgi:HK97 gp10 family phage protein